MNKTYPIIKGVLLIIIGVWFVLLPFYILTGPLVSGSVEAKVSALFTIIGAFAMVHGLLSSLFGVNDLLKPEGPT